MECAYANVYLFESSESFENQGEVKNGYVLGKIFPLSDITNAKGNLANLAMREGGVGKRGIGGGGGEVGDRSSNLIL